MFRDVPECLDAGNRLHTLLASQKPSRKSIPILIDVEQGICNGPLGIFKNSVQQYIIFVYSFFFSSPELAQGELLGYRDVRRPSYVWTSVTSETYETSETSVRQLFSLCTL